jgi:hypothetical protein
MCFIYYKTLIITATITVVTASCSSSQSLKVTANETVAVSLVSTKSPDRIVDRFGNSPVEIKIDKLPGNMLKLTKPGKLPQFIYPIQLSDGLNEIQVNLRQLSKIPEVQAFTASKVDPNLIQKMLLDAYEAINIDGDLEKAETIADEMIALDKNTFSPRLIKALIYLQKGDTKNAKIQAELAQSLYPSNYRVNQILEAIDKGL